MWSAHTTDRKRKEILTHATAWMDLESVTLSEANISRRTKPTRLYFPEVPGVIKFIETESRMVVAGGCGGRQQGVGV